MSTLESTGIQLYRNYEGRYIMQLYGFQAFYQSNEIPVSEDNYSYITYTSSQQT